MGLLGKISEGDLVRAEAEDGSIIIGRAQNDVFFGSSAILSIGLNGSYVTINVNFWKSVRAIPNGD